MKETPEPATRSDSADAPVLFVLLGASNLHRGYGALTDCLRRSLFPRRVEFLTAMGPGRAYCAQGGFLFVRYPAIGSIGILQAAKQRKQAGVRVVALITDIGSDIMYNVPVAEIRATLERIFQELSALEAEVFVTEIPVNLNEIPPWQFTLLKRLYFPRSPKRFDEVSEAVASVNAFLRQSAQGRVHLLPNMRSFCGFDKIHYKSLQIHRVWEQVAAAMLAVLGVPHPKPIRLTATARSLAASLDRLLFCDFTPLRKKSGDLY